MNEEENIQPKNFKEIDRGSILKLKLTHHTKEVDLIENSNTFDIFIEKNKKIYCIHIPNGLSQHIRPWSFYEIIDSD